MNPEHEKTWTRLLALDMLMLGVSFSISVIGQMIGAIRIEYGMSLSQAGVLMSAQSIGGSAVAVMCMLIVDSLNKTKLVVLSGVTLSILLILIGVKLPLYTMFIVFVFLGLSLSTVNMLNNALMADTAGRKAKMHINLMHMVASLASVLIPLISNALYDVFGLSGVFYIIGGFSLFWAIYSVVVFRTEVKQKFVNGSIHYRARIAELGRVLRNPGVKELGIIVFLISCWQLSAMYYTSSLFFSLTNSPRYGAYALTILYLGIMLSRLLYSRVANRFSQGRAIATGSLLCLVTWIFAILVQNTSIKMITIGVAAFFSGNNYPISFSAACILSPKNTAAALGIVFSGYYLALLIFIPIIGTLGEKIGLNNALGFSGIPLMFLVPLALLLHKKMKTTGLC